jgi:hypothetical protein
VWPTGNVRFGDSTEIAQSQFLAGTKGAIAEQRKFIVLLKMLRAGVT